MRYHAWIYPGAPAQSAPRTYRMHHINVLRVQYFTVQNNGTLEMHYLDPENLEDTENAFSPENLADLQAHCDEVLITVSCSIHAFRALYASDSVLQNFETTLLAFCQEWDVAGIDLDLEGYGHWLPADYAAYKRLVFSLGSTLRNFGKRMAICGPTDYDPANQAYLFRYEDIVCLPVDYITAMCYDFQYLDVLGAPLAPLKWIDQWTRYLLRLSSPDRIVIGVPSYSYRFTKGCDTVSNVTLEQAKRANLYKPENRDRSSAEIIVDTGGEVWVICDGISLTKKVQEVMNAGATQVSVWHLGGNDWLTGRA